MSVETFDSDDTGYIDWLERHPDGYVVNTRQVIDPEYLVLHQSGCSSIRKYPKMEENPGGFTERRYRKICATSHSELKNYLVHLTGNSSPFSKVCVKCDS